jgi:hypothetical protein
MQEHKDEHLEPIKKVTILRDEKGSFLYGLLIQKPSTLVFECVKNFFSYLEGNAAGSAPEMSDDAEERD